MIKVMWFHTWRRSIYALLAWLSFCILMGLYIFSLYNYLLTMPDYMNYLMDMPFWVLFFLGRPLHGEVAVNFLLLTSLNFIVPLIWIILVIRIGISEIAGEEERGRLDFILAHPVPRWKLFLNRVTALISLVFIMALILWGSLTAIIQIANMPVSVVWALTYALDMSLFVLWVGALAMLLGAWRGNSDQATLMCVLLIVLLWLLQGAVHVRLLPAIWLWFNPLGLVFMLTNENNPMTLLITGIMLVVILVTVFIGVWIWQQRSFFTQEDTI